ncbi:hypothetical protein S245_056096, partial [Arachis hypogaea]
RFIGAVFDAKGADAILSFEKFCCNLPRPLLQVLLYVDEKKIATCFFNDCYASNYRGSWILTFSLLTCDLSSLKNGRLSCLLLLRSSKVFFDLFRHDVRLRKACSTTLQTHSRFIGREKLCNDGRYMKVNVDFIFARYTSCFLADKVICSSGFLLMDLLERSDGFYSNIWTM